MVAYGGWIGFGPWVARLAQTPAGSLDRLTQYIASLPLLREFPILGVGLGAYRDIYFRHQPLAHHPDRFYFPYAHNDLLQLVLELGVVGAVLCAFFAWRLAPIWSARTCSGVAPVRWMAARGQRRCAAIASASGSRWAPWPARPGLTAHSALDFSVRIPAVGFLAAALLGLATVALHTRMQPDHEQLLSGVRVLSLTRPRRAAATGALALVVLGGWSWAWIHGTRVRAAEQALRWGRRAEQLARADAVLAIDSASMPARRQRARVRLEAAVAAWRSAPAPGVDRDRAARDLLALARADLRAAIVVVPTYPNLHLDLGWVEATDALVQGRSGPEGLAPALTHGARAVALGADSPIFYAGMARLAYSVPELSMKAAREAVRRDPALLVEMVDLYQPMGLHRHRVADHRARARGGPARSGDGPGGAGPACREPRRLPRRPGGGPPREVIVYRWALADALGRLGADDEAIAVLREAVVADAEQPRAAARARRRAGASERSRGARPLAPGGQRHRAAG